LIVAFELSPALTTPALEPTCIIDPLKVVVRVCHWSLATGADAETAATYETLTFKLLGVSVIGVFGFDGDASKERKRFMLSQPLF
jgi:hypothetical protein